LIKKYSSLSKKVVPIHLGVDINKFQPSVKKNPDHPNLGILGNLDQQLAAVFERILKEYRKNAGLDLAGKGLSKKFSQFNCIQEIIFKGFVKRVRASETLSKH